MEARYGADALALWLTLVDVRRAGVRVAAGGEVFDDLLTTVGAPAGRVTGADGFGPPGARFFCAEEVVVVLPALVGRSAGLRWRVLPYGFAVMKSALCGRAAASEVEASFAELRALHAEFDS